VNEGVVKPADERYGIRRFGVVLEKAAFSPHRHDVYTLALTISGVQCFNYRGALRQSLPGHVVVLHPDELHDGHPGTVEGFAYRAITIPPAIISALSPGRALPFVRDGLSLDPSLKEAVCELLLDIDEELEPLQISDCLLQITSALVAAGGTKLARLPTDGRAAERAREYIHEHLARPVLMADLEHAVGQDRWQLSRDFRQLYGTSPYRYLVMRRLDLARERILQGENAAETALACGFSDQSHMNRHFKAAHGLSPKAWKHCVTTSTRDARTIVQ
jgi:AraC-like DNA-binding protein